MNWANSGYIACPGTRTTETIAAHDPEATAAVTSPAGPLFISTPIRPSSRNFGESAAYWLASSCWLPDEIHWAGIQRSRLDSPNLYGSIAVHVYEIESKFNSSVQSARCITRARRGHRCRGNTLGPLAVRRRRREIVDQ
jgi:hypothetical protein